MIDSSGGVVDEASIETRVSGHGQPVTVVAHGLGETLDQARVWASGVRGTRVFPQFRGHGRTPAPPGPWSYDDLVAELRTVADSRAATRAVGASLGSAVLLRWLQVDHDRFERLVLVLPAMYDEPRPRTTERPWRHESPDYQALLETPPVTDPDRLRGVVAPVLLIAQRGDDEHPAWIAERIAGAFPHATLEILPEGGILERHRRRVRDLIGSFLNR